MAIAFINLTSKNNLSGTEGAQTFTGPTVSGSDTILLIAVTQNYSSEPADPVVLYNSVNLGAPTWETAWVDYNKTWVWLVKNPGSAQTVSIDIASGRASAIAISYNGVDQTTTYRTATIGTGASSPATLNVTNSETGDLIVGFFGTDDDATGFTSANVGAGQTFRANIINDTQEAIAACCDEPGASPSVTHSWVYTGSYGWSEIAIPLIPAGGGAGKPYPIYAQQ